MPRAFILALAGLGVVLTATVVPGLFTIDEDNYLVNVVALRGGHVTVVNTTGLPPSRGLAFFDPALDSRAVTSTPVGSTAPPLYAPLALPFVWFGWRGLVALNTLAFLATCVMVFRYAQRHAADASTPWLAAAAFALGGFGLEYAQGLWPHCLSIALCTGGVLLVGRVIEGDRAAKAAAASLLLGLATGVRYQNAVILLAAGGAVALWSPRRWRATLAYAAGAVPPLAMCAVINHLRLDSWNPISKGPGYLNLPVVHSGGNAFDPLLMLWARVVDFTARPALTGALGWVNYDPTTGAHLIFGAAPQKAFLQSAPWAALALACFAAAWWPRFRMAEADRRQVKLFSVVAGALLAVFAISGRARYEGASFNQRYLLELVPLTAITFAWAVDGLRVRVPSLFAGALWGVLTAVLFVLVLPNGTLRLLAILKFPLLLSIALAVAWWLARRSPVRQPLLTALIGMSVGWALALHLTDDMAASRAVRRANLANTEGFRRALPDHSAVFAHWGTKDPAGPLLLEKDIVIFDTHADQGRDASILIEALLRQGRRVFVLQSGTPSEVLARVQSGWRTVYAAGRGATLELRASGE